MEDGTLLKRFCFILRIACQTPDQKVSSILKKDSRGLFFDLLFLKPYGKGWQALIRFLFNSRESLSNTLALHVTALLNDWVSVLHLEQPLPVLAHKVGLLAIHFLSAIKESYRNRDDGERKKLLSIILKTSSEIQDEFVALLEADVFARRGGRHQRMLHYVDEFCEMAFSGIEAAFFCKYNPDLLIKLARFEWFVQEPDEDNKSWSRSRTDVAECFGLHEYKYQFFPASGAKGPFSSLLMYHPRKGLDFIIELLNVTAHNYAHSNLDHSNGYYYLSVKQPSTLIEHIKIQLNDGVTINQYCTSRLWLAYRGKSVIPYLLQCALMALENWLVAYTENCGPSIIEWLFDYILRNSNSVMPTAVLASVAIGFPNKVGKAALPLLRSPELYALDLGRSVQEMGENESNWFSYNRDAFYELYTQDRRTAALRPWRKEHLENLITRLQFSEWREEALAAIDMLNASAPKNETMRFLLHRIDSRGWKPVEDKENNRIIFESSTLETDLKEIQQKSQDDMRIINRFSALYIWAKKTFSRETIENQYNATLGEALSEATELISELNKDIENDFPPMYCGSLVTAATVFVRDYYSELTEEYSWCSSLILEIVKAKADSDDPSAAADATDHDGAAAAATVLPILLDFASNDEDKLMIIEAIVTALTHVNENVRLGAADGIREYLWEREPVFAHYCLIGAIEYARFEQSTLYDRRLTDFEEENYWEISRVKQKVKKDEFRQKFLRGE